ncbi:ABC transporter B family member 1-like [Hypanus sabinus]|uniref:ABC transporter B family member 1-like n=1 Tax=Hypanus sabinus TaxID=79690 RepID=UPI0028C45067|nr:ABC transporter B family member 1-like [Hypanus sabinus]XP_059844069.1 ABC transporter B family member 1-like [Hypanus sabinus]XP_059844070.1 ABC transporter B family member 1-like [Hypanus sabinus]
MAQDSIYYYRLPAVRFIPLINIILFVDGISTIMLWILGGRSHYLENDVLKWCFWKSTFDLAAFCTMKTCILIVIYLTMESIALKQIDDLNNCNLKRKREFLHLISFTISGLWVAYTIAKGITVLVTQSYKEMHLTFKIVCISTVVFSLVEFPFCVFCNRFLRRLQIFRIVQSIEEERDQKSKADLKRLFCLAKDEVLICLGGMLALVVSCLSQIVAPFFFGKVIDSAMESMAELDRMILILFGIYVGGAVCSFVRAYFFVLAGHRLVARLRKRLFGSIIKQEIAFFDENRTGELTNRLSSDTQIIQNTLTVNLSMLLRYTLQIIGSIVLMFVVSPALTGVLLASIPVVAIGGVLYGEFVKRLRKQFQDELAAVGSTAEETISNIRTVRTFCSEKKSEELYGKGIDKSYQIGKKLALAEGSFSGLVLTISQGAIVLVLWYGAKLVYDGRHGKSGISFGTLASFMVYSMNVAMAFGMLASLYGDFMQAVGASIRIFELLDRKPKIPCVGGSRLDSLEGRLEFQKVSFTYPTRQAFQVLKEMTFEIEPGNMVALVGPSGGGKSTIVNLIERFYDPDSGRILLGKYDLQNLDPQWFRQKISVVSQEPTLFATSIKKNITYGREANMEEVIDAAKKANAHDFIMSFENGYETMVGEHGIRLSGGQKQRIAIARALIMDPVLLLLDEATSALDAESEHLVQEAIDRVMQERTVLVIAHRLSTVRNASKVIVIDKGRIVECGTHRNLLEKGRIYKKLVLHQLTAGAVRFGRGGFQEDDAQGEEAANPERERWNNADIDVREQQCG